MKHKKRFADKHPVMFRLIITAEDAAIHGISTEALKNFEKVVTGYRWVLKSDGLVKSMHADNNVPVLRCIVDFDDAATIQSFEAFQHIRSSTMSESLKRNFRIILNVFDERFDGGDFQEQERLIFRDNNFYFESYYLFWHESQEFYEAFLAENDKTAL